jgi:uracil-DNA glycosylase
MLFDQDGNMTCNTLINYPDTDYNRLKEEALKCKRCRLREEASQVVMGEGSINNRIMFIGEAPGGDEDRIGVPFVGRAGQLLDKIFEAVNIKREEIYITNIVKCRPKGNRNPFQGEMTACAPILIAEIKLINPKVIVPLGSVALKNLLDEQASITEMRGKWIKRGDYFFFPTFHPSYLLRNPVMKKVAWHDFKVIKKAIDRIKELKNEDA